MVCVNLRVDVLETMLDTSVPLQLRKILCADMVPLEIHPCSTVQAIVKKKSPKSPALRNTMYITTYN